MAKIKEVFGGIQEAAKEKIGTAQEAISDAYAERQKKELLPIFVEDLPTVLLKYSIIAVQNMDKKHQNSEVCKGSIGHIVESKKSSFLVIYPDRVLQSGLSFLTNASTINQKIYVKSSYGDNEYIDTNYLYDYEDDGRVNELVSVASNLGAKYVSVKFFKEVQSSESSAKKIKLGLKKDGGKAETETKQTSSREVYISSKYQKVQTLKGHNNPVATPLVFFKGVSSVESLISDRVNKRNEIHNTSYEFEGKSKSVSDVNMSESISAAYGNCGLKGGAEFRKKYAEREKIKLQYKVEFPPKSFWE